MISIISDLPAGIVGFEASGEVSAEDYRQALDPLVEQATSGGAKVRALALLGADVSYKGGAMLEDARLGLHEWSAWERIAIVSDDRQGMAEALAPALGISPTDALESPHALCGTVEQICDDLVARRERFGISSIGLSLDALDAMAPVVARLAGT